MVYSLSDKIHVAKSFCKVKTSFRCNILYELNEFVVNKQFCGNMKKQNRDLILFSIFWIFKYCIFLFVFVWQNYRKYMDVGTGGASICLIILSWLY